MIELADLYARYSSRKMARSPLIEKMRAVQEQYNGDVIVPLPELSAGEKAAVGNLLTAGIDQLAERIASNTPDVNYAPVRPNIKASQNLADTRRKATLAWWEQNKVGNLLKLRARYYVGYGSTPVKITPNMDLGIPRWELRSPLACYPAPTNDITAVYPDDCISTYPRTAYEVGQLFGTTMAGAADAQFELIEYCDADETVLAVLGPAKTSNGGDVFAGIGKEIINLEPPSFSWGQMTTPGKSMALVKRIPNRAAMPLVVMANRVSLDKLMGQFDQTLGMYQLQARLMALEVIAVEHGVFPDEWLISRDSQVPDIVVPADGRKGVMGVVTGGVIERHNLTPGTQTYPMMDRLERGQRVTAGIPAELQGEGATNVRTGKRGDSIMSATIDFPIKEAQDMLATSMQTENCIAIATMKSYFGNDRKQFFVTWKNAKGPVDYIANEVFENDNQMVSFSHAGSDANSLIVGLGQRLGLGLISNLTAAKLDPLIDDADFEHDQVLSEKMETALLTSIQQAGTTGSLGADDLAFISEQVITGKVTLFEAVQKAHTRAQARQAQSAPPGDPAGPVPEGSPAAQPGLASGTPAAAGAAAPTIGPPNASIGNLSQLLSSLHRPNAAARAESSK
jgi:hypothetical protein